MEELRVLAEPEPEPEPKLEPEPRCFSAPVHAPR